MNQIFFNTAIFNTSIIQTSIFIEMSCENTFGKMDQIFISRKFFISKSSQTIILNEKVDFMLSHPEAFIQLNLYSLEKQSQNYKQIKSCVFLLPDLITPSNSMIIPLSESENIKINFTLLTQEKRSFNEESAYAFQDNEQDYSSMLDLFSITQRFLRSITPLRRLSNHIKKSITHKNIKRDLKLLFCLLFLLFFPNLTIILTIFYFIFSNAKYKIRFWFVEQGIHFFYNQMAATELKKNLLFIKELQLAIIALLDQIKKFVYLKNRVLMYEFFCRYIFLLIPAFFFISLIPKWIFLSFFAIAVFCLKYSIEIENSLLKFIPFFSKTISKMPLFDNKKILFQNFYSKNYKTTFIYEVQFFTAFGSSSGLSFSYGYLIRFS